MPRGGRREGAGRKRQDGSKPTARKAAPPVVKEARTDPKRTGLRVRASTVKAQAAFLREFAQSGNVRLACESAKVPRSTLYDTWVKNETFKALYDQATDDAADLLEEEARRRAVDGVDEPVYQAGKLCGKVRKYSDTLMVVLLKARRPLVFRERIDHKHTGHLTLEQVLDASRGDGASA